MKKLATIYNGKVSELVDILNEGNVVLHQLQYMKQVMAT